MGFAPPIIRHTPKPRHKGTVVCPHCHAEYSPTTEFATFTGPGLDDTTGSLGHLISIIPLGTCPWCRRPRPEEPT